MRTIERLREYSGKRYLIEDELRVLLNALPNILAKLDAAEGLAGVLSEQIRAMKERRSITISEEAYQIMVDNYRKVEL